MRRKVFSALMCAAMVTSLFAGCGSSDSGTTASNSGSTTGDGTEVAAEDACRIEHVISAETFERLKEHVSAQDEAGQ